MDLIYQRMNDDTEQASKEKPESEIQAFYSGKTIFLTGCTGFIGKCLVEKILRACQDIKRLYILVRPKKSQSIEKRMEDYFDNIVFQKLRKENPKFREKITIIEGDISMPGLDLSPENRQFIIEEVDLIIHNAAMVIFSAKVSTILKTNVFGTKEMLDLARECHHLKGFMHVSTAYSHCYSRIKIEEKFYEPPADLQVVRDMIKADMDNEEGLSKEALKDFLGPCPNAYIFTKAIGESIVQEYAKKVSFPCGIFRMSIVVSTYEEPLRSWCGNANGPIFMLMTAGLGLLHVLIVAEGKPDWVPADMTANACLVCVRDLVENQKDCKEGCIYNYGSSTHNAINFLRFRKLTNIYGNPYPSISSMGLFFLIFTDNYYTFMIYHLFFHYFPAFVADMYRLLRMKKMKYVPVLRKVGKHLNELVFFMQHNWIIETDRMLKIWNQQNSTDYELFFSDLRKIDWDQFSMTFWSGLRVYVLKEPMDNVVAARRRYIIVSIGTIVLYTLTVLLLLYGFYSLIISRVFA